MSSNDKCTHRSLLLLYAVYVGPYMKDIVPLLSSLPEIEGIEDEETCCPAPVLYAGENDHEVRWKIKRRRCVSLAILDLYI